MLYGAHDSAENSWSAEELEKELQDIDIWFLENIGWTEDAVEYLKAFATGKYVIPEHFDPILKSQLEALGRLGRAGKEIGVGFIDLPEGHPLIDHLRQDLNGVFFDFQSGNFDDAVRKMKSCALKDASIEKRREEHMQQHVGPEVDRIVQKNPRLQEKLKKGEKLNILMTLGTRHTALSRDLKDEGHSVERKFNHELPFTFAPFHELVRRYRFSQEVDQRLVAQALLFPSLLSALTFLDIVKMERVANKIARTASLEAYAAFL